MCDANKLMRLIRRWSSAFNLFWAGRGNTSREKALEGSALGNHWIDGNEALLLGFWSRSFGPRSFKFRADFVK